MNSLLTDCVEAPARLVDWSKVIVTVSPSPRPTWLFVLLATMERIAGVVVKVPINTMDDVLLTVLCKTSFSPALPLMPTVVVPGTR